MSLETVFVPTGALLLILAALTWRDRGHPHRVACGCFWLILGVIFAAGGVMPHWLTGLLVLALVALDGAGRVGRGRYLESTEAERAAHARRLGNRIFLPVLVIPAVTFALGGVFRLVGQDGNRGALIGVGLGALVAMVVALRLTGGTVQELLDEGRRINDAMGAVNILPQLLASLGVIFTAAGIGDLIARAIRVLLPDGNLFLLVLANCAGMALFTMIVGNSFAAFPVIASGVLVPLLVRPFGIDPAMAAIVTLTAGSTGTLMTPMAANFNLVPAALLEMRDTYGVIRFQVPYALALWALHVAVMWLWVRLA